MRLRKNWSARPQMEASSYCIYNPYELKGKWSSVFSNPNPIELELGCGRGAFICKMAMENPCINYVAVDLKDEVLIYLLREIEKNNITNVRILPMNIMLMNDVFANNEISGIYLNFSTPWPKDRHNKRRLTYNTFLKMYKGCLNINGLIMFKTDNESFFRDSLEYFKEENFTLEYVTYDLHNSEYNVSNITTEYEEKFSKMGMKIMFCIARHK